MDDYTVARSGTAPHLTGHLRALALIEPLQRVEDTKTLLHVDDPEIVATIDMRYLALAAIELLIDRMGVGGTASRFEVVEHLAGLTRIQRSEITEKDSTALAEHVFDWLTNARQRRARFATHLFEPGTPGGVTLEFSLLRAEALPNGTVGYRLTQEAIEVHLSLLAQDPLTATQISEMIVGEFLKRGLYDHAASAAERTRTNSIRLAEALHLLMAEARRAIRKVLWHDELGPHMEDARTLLDESNVREGAMLAQLNDTAADVTDETDRRHIARIRNLLLDVQMRHRRLMTIVQTTADEYLKLQADVLKLRQMTRLPDLENEILDPLLRSSIHFLGEVASDTFGSISGPLTPLVFDFAATIAAFEPEPGEEEISEEEIEFALPTDPMKLPFDDRMIEKAEGFERPTIFNAGSITLGDVLAAAAAAHPGESAFLRCLFLVLEQAIDPRTTDVTQGASILQTRFDAGFVTGADVNFTNGTIEASHVAK
jgi:hypothetical protein